MQVAKSTESFRVIRHMTVSHADFLRNLPAMMGERSYTVSGRLITVDEPPVIKICLSEETCRKFGPILLPVTHIELEFLGYGKRQMDEFLDRFDFYYWRAGG